MRCSAATWATRSKIKEAIPIRLKKIISRLLSRNAAVILLILLQIGFILLSVTALGEKYYIIYFALILLDVILAVFITNKSEPSSYKLTWLVTISIFPLFGGISYLLIKLSQRQPKLADSQYRKNARPMLSLKDVPTRSTFAGTFQATGFIPFVRMISLSIIPSVRYSLSTS